MRKLLFSISLLLSVQAVFSQLVAAKLDSLIKAYSTLHLFNGSVLVSKGESILLNKGYGYRNAEKKVANDKNSIFQIGSVTKQFTSAIILKLQDENKLNVKDKLSKYFPSYPKGDSITIQQLLTHTSGIFNYTDDADFMMNQSSSHANRKKMMALFKDKPLDFSPGTDFKYSNSGYLLLGYIIEIIRKQPYEKAVREMLFQPLQMTHSGFDFTHLNSDDKTTGYMSVDEKSANAAPIFDSTCSFSAGGIYSSTGDLYKWHQGLEKNQILSARLQEKAFTHVRNHYGYGWDIDSLEGKRRVSHGGGIPGYVSKFSRIPEDDICIVLLSNGSDATLEEISKSIYSVLYNKPYKLPEETMSITVPVETLSQYAGQYEVQPGYNMTFTVTDSQLVARAPGNADMIMYAQTLTMFTDRKKNVKIEFLRNENGVTGFTLFQPGHGGNIICKKIK